MIRENEFTKGKIEQRNQLMIAEQTQLERQLEEMQERNRGDQERLESLQKQMQAKEKEYIEFQ